MKGKYKITYQVGGDTPNQYEDTSFFDLLSKYAQGTQQDEPEESDNPQEENKEQYDGYDQSDFQSLQDKYDELSSRFDELSNIVGSPSGYKGDDEFLNFMFDDSNNNAPLDISMPTAAPSTPSSNSRANPGFRSFNSPEEGRAALEHQLELYKSGASAHTTGNETLYEAMAKYAPAADHNNPRAYAEFIGKKLGISPNTPIKQVDTKRWADAVTQMEGNKKGNNPGNLRPFQNGGEPNKYQQFYDGYINSPAYKDRLLLQGYREQDINNIKSERLNNVKTSKLVQIEGDPHNIDYNSSAIVPHEVRYNPVEGPQDEIASHEYAHKAGASETKYSGNPAISMNANEIYLFNTLNKSTKSGHMTNPYEAKADLDSLRFMMEDGYIKSPSQKYEIEDLQKADKKDNIKKSTIYRRLNGRYKQEDLLKLLNDVAGTNSNELQTAQNGGRFAPVYTNNPNDPRLRAYQDSLQRYDFSSRREKELSSLPHVKMDRKAMSNDPLFSYDEMLKNEKGFLPVASNFYPTWNNNQGKYLGIYKKPVQPIIYQKKSNLNGLKKAYDTFKSGQLTSYDDIDKQITSVFKEYGVPYKDGTNGPYDISWIENKLNNKPEPRLKRMPYTPATPIEPQPYGNPQNIVPVNDIPERESNYRVDYQENGQNAHRNFPNAADGSRFQELISGNRTGYWEKFQNGGGHLGLPEINMSNPVDNNNVSNRRDVVVQPHVYTEEEKRLLREQEIERNRGTIKGITKEEYNKSKSAPLGEILRSPMTAIKRKLHNQELPANFSKAERNPYDSALDIVNPLTYLDAATHTAKNIASPIETTKTLAKGSVNLASNLIDGRNIYEDGSNEKSLGILGDAAMTLPIATNMKNAYKLNPWAFKPNPNAYYHRSPNIENIINKEKGILQGFGESEAGKRFNNESRLSSDGKINLTKSAFQDLYTSKGTPLDFGRSNNWKQGYEGPYLAEITNHPMAAKVNGKFRNVLQEDGTYLKGVPPNGLGDYAVPVGNVPLNNVEFYKEDWLRGYKKLNKPDNLVDLYRIQEKDARTFSQLANEGKIHQAFNTPEVLARKAEEEKYFGQWFTKDKNDLEFYKNDREFTNPEIINLKVPQSKLSQYQNYDKSLSRAPDREFVIPQSDQGRYRRQMGGDVSQQGYNFDSPYNNAPYLYIDSPTGEITMEKTRIPLLGVDEFGNKKIMKPGKKYKFAGTKIKEIPIK